MSTDALESEPPRAPGLQGLLEDPERFTVAVEIETSRGLLTDASSSRAYRLAHQLADYDGVDILAVTDNPGGNPHIRPEVLGRELLERGQPVTINLSCKDYNRNGLESRLWALGSMGLYDVLAITGDYPASGYAGQAQAVFDIDSVGLLEIIRQMNRGVPIPRRRPSKRPDRLEQTRFFPGAAVNPFKRRESEFMPQLFKLALKVQTGARWIVTQLGYDSRKLDALVRYMRLKGIDAPVIGSVYILSAPAARFFNRGAVPGATVTDDLLAVVEREAASEDKGRQFFAEFAAKQIAVLRGLGYRGVYLSGRPPAARVRKILELERSFGANDWKDFAREIRFSQPGEFHYFEEDPDTGLNSDEVDPEYVASRKRGARALRRLTVSPAYRFGRLGHELLFDRRAPGFRVGRKVYQGLEHAPAILRQLAHAAELAVKVPVWRCQDCGDCSLPDIAYLCPQSQCAKNQRNGPCGGTHDGQCEILDKECIWVRAYMRLKAYGEETEMLARPAVFKNSGLQGTSSWANTFLERDHHAAANGGRPGAP